jgi:hypothetical protein
VWLTYITPTCTHHDHHPHLLFAVRRTRGVLYTTSLCKVASQARMVVCVCMCVCVCVHVPAHMHMLAYVNDVFVRMWWCSWTGRHRGIYQ